VPDFNRRAFPHRVKVLRKGPGKLDPSKGRTNDYDPEPFVYPCKISQSTPQTMPDLMVVGSEVDTIIMFPPEPDPAVLAGDVLLECDPDSGVENGHGYAVVREKFTGSFRLQRWQVDAKRRQVQ